MIYKFTYYFNDKIYYKTCTTQREADVFFNILVSANLPFRVITTTKRSNIYGYL